VDSPKSCAMRQDAKRPGERRFPEADLKRINREVAESEGLGVRKDNGFLAGDADILLPQRLERYHIAVPSISINPKIDALGQDPPPRDH